LYRKAFFIQVDEYLPDDHRIFNAGNHFDRTTAGTAPLNVDIENPLETPGLKLMAAHRSAAVRSCARSGAWGLLPLSRLADVTCTRCKLLGANTPWKQVRLTLGLGARAANLAMKSKGSKTTGAVPSR
jgi:hypothetical protein